MIKDWKKIVSVVCFCGAMSVMPITAYGDTVENGQASEAAADGEDLPETDDELAADTVTEEEVQEVLRVISDLRSPISGGDWRSRCPGRGRGSPHR